MEVRTKSFAKLLDEMNAFHDLDVGFLEVKKKSFYLIIEDHSGVRKPTDLSSVPAVAHIRANKVSDFALSLDMAMPDIVYELVEPEPGKLEICMDNDCIFIEAEDIDIQLCK